MKTKTQILSVLIFFTSIYNFSSVYAWFWSSTFIDSSQQILKVHWENRLLYVYEDYISNPFLNSQIIQNQTNWVISSYSVGWRIFSSTHPLYLRANRFQTPNFITESPGIRTRVEYLENTFTNVWWIITPKQSVRTRKHYQVSFNFDTTAPTAGDLELYNDQDGTELFQYLGWWINSPKYYTMYCNDPETGCKCDPLRDTQCEIYNWRVRLIPQILGHMSLPIANFTNNVDLSSNINWTLPGWIDILYDQVNPRVWMYFWENIFIPRHDFETRLDSNRNYLLDENNLPLDGENTPWNVHYQVKKEIHLLANDTLKLHILLDDVFTESSLSWVSGLARYNLTIEKKNSSNVFTEIHTQSRVFDPYNPDGSLELTNREMFTVEYEEMLHNYWDFRAILDVYDAAGNHTKVIALFYIHPNYPDYSQSSISVEERELFDGKILADNKSYLRYTVRLRDRFQNPIYWKLISKIEQDIEWFTNGKTIYLDMISESWERALQIRNILPLITNSDWVFEFDLYSYTPWTFTQRFNIDYNLWDNEYQDNSIIESLFLWRNIGYQENEFFIPLSWSISLEDGLPQLWKQQEYSIEISNPSNLMYSNARLEIWINTLNFSTPHRFREVIINNNRFSNINPKVTFTWSIDITQESAALMVPKLQVNNLPVRYTLSGKNVRYALANLENNFCEVDTISTLWVSIIWSLQWSWRWNITWQNENITDISVVETREQIRRNALNLISWRTWNGDVINNIKYVSGENITLSWNQNYETLIVRNGNVIISDNITKDIWIIVIRDAWYDLTRDYNTNGNIFISNTVSEIHAIIYADGTIRSAKSNWESYNDAELWTSLFITWAIFTRNTIGWAVWIDNNYLLPGGWSTWDFSLAEIYDLNFLRKTNLCNPPNYSLRIEYNQTVISNPPPWF